MKGTMKQKANVVIFKELFFPQVKNFQQTSADTLFEDI